MSLELLGKDDVQENSWDEELRQAVNDAQELSVSLLENSGFTNYEFCHPTEDYNVSYFVRDCKVIMLDNHVSGSYEVKILNDKDALWVLENIRKEFGEQELNR